MLDEFDRIKVEGQGGFADCTQEGCGSVVQPSDGALLPAMATRAPRRRCDLWEKHGEDPLQVSIAGARTKTPARAELARATTARTRRTVRTLVNMVLSWDRWGKGRPGRQGEWAKSVFLRDRRLQRCRQQGASSYQHGYCFHIRLLVRAPSRAWCISLPSAFSPALEVITGLVWRKSC